MKNIAINAAYKALAAAIVIASSSSAPANAQAKTTIDQYHLMAGDAGLSLRHIPQPQSGRAQLLQDEGVRASTQIVDGVQVVQQDWANLKPLVTKVLSGETLDVNQRALGFNGANTMTGNMNLVVGLYSHTSKPDL